MTLIQEREVVLLIYNLQLGTGLHGLHADTWRVVCNEDGEIGERFAHAQ